MNSKVKGKSGKRKTPKKKSSVKREVSDEKKTTPQTSPVLSATRSLSSISLGRRKRRVRFGFSAGSFYETHKRSMSGQYSRDTYKRGSLITSGVTVPLAVGSEFEDVEDKLTGHNPRNRVHRSASTPTKLERHFGVSSLELKFLKRNQKVLKFFGEAPPPSSYLQHSAATATKIYHKYIAKGSLCDVRLPLQLRENIKDKIATKTISAGLFTAALEEVAGWLHRDILPKYTGKTEEDANSALQAMQRILDSKDTAEPFLKWCKRTSNIHVLNFVLAIEQFQQLADTAVDTPPVPADDDEKFSSPLTKEAFSIYRTYVRAGAVREIGAAAETKSAIKEVLDLDKVGRHMFDNAQRHARAVLREDILPKFLAVLPSTQREWTLNQIFEDRNMTKSFLRFCKTIHSEENALFYLAVEQFKNRKSPFKVIRRQAENEAVASLLTSRLHRKRRLSAMRYSAPSMASVAHAVSSAVKSSSVSAPPAMAPPALSPSKKAGAVSEKLSRLGRAQRMYDKFIKSGAVSELNLPPKTRAAILRSLKASSTPPTLFEEAKKHILHILTVETFPQYQATKLKGSGSRPRLFSLSRKKTAPAPTEELVEATLADKTKRQDFVKFCKTLHCDEQVQFYLQALKFKEVLPTTKKRANMAGFGSDTPTDSKQAPVGDSDSDDSSDEDELPDLDSFANKPKANLPRIRRFDYMGRPSFSRTTSQDDNVVLAIREVADIELSPTSKHKHKRVKSILKLPKASLEAEKVMRRVRQWREERLQRYLKRCSAGEVLIKYDKNRKPVKRFFKLDVAEHELRWGKPGAKTLKKKTNMIEVLGMHYGPFSDRFDRFDCSVGKSWHCMVVEFSDRTVDILFDDVEQFTAWFLALQSVAPLNLTYMSPGALLWARANMKVDKMAYFARTSPGDVWATLLLAARHAVHGTEIPALPALPPID